jgi:Fe-S-cluster containining protein
MLQMRFRYYRQLVAQIDKWTEEMTSRYRSHLVCRKGCDLCCQRKFSVSAVEAYNMAFTFSQLTPAQRAKVRPKKSSCIFLVNGACTVYESRPVICRTFGLPSLHRNEKGEGVASWCELNFTNAASDFTFQADGIIDVDMLNAKLAAVNSLFLKESGLTRERIPMDEIPKLDTRIIQRED